MSPRRRPFFFASCATAVALLGCSATPGTEDDGTSAEQAISVSDIMTRADQYLAADIVYCGGPKGSPDETGCGEGTCEQPSGPWDGYRSDCSGFVSYVWQIPSDPDTATYSYDQSGSQGWSTIGIDDLRAGDAVVAEGHIKLFGELEGASAALIYEEYDCNLIAHKEVQAFSRSGNQIWFDGDSRAYHAIRRNALTAPAPAPTPIPTPPKGPPTPLPAPTSGCGTIAAGHGLAPGKAIRSCDSRFELVMQGDGNLVEYGPTGSMWSSKTSGSDGYEAQMQGDGNFVLYNRHSGALFDTGSSGSGARLIVQTDGNIVVYDGNRPLWQSKTGGFRAAPAEPTACGVMPGGRGLAAGHSLKSCNGRYTLAMQTDGDLVLYEGSHALWSSRTAGHGGYEAVMQGDGNLVVYAGEGPALWSAATAGDDGARLQVQDDGNVVIYDSQNHARWASDTVQR